MKAGVVIVMFALVLFSTTDTFFLAKRRPQEQDEIKIPRSYRVRSPNFGRVRTRFIELEQFPDVENDLELSLKEINSADKRGVSHEYGVVFPWNEWKCQVRGCRKRN